MSKSYKLKDNIYVDSKSIVNNKIRLDQEIGNTASIWSTHGLDITISGKDIDKFTFIIVGHDNGPGNMNITAVGFYKNIQSDCSYTRILGNKTVTRKSQYVYHIDATQWGWYYAITPPGIIATLTLSTS